MASSSIHNEAGRIVWLDIIKFIAIFMMVAVHCTDNVTHAERSEPWYYTWGSLYGSLMRPAIPLFVMVTGALLLPVKESTLSFYRKRMPRVVIPFLIWSVLYNLFPWATGVAGLPPETINGFFAWAEPDQSFSGAVSRILMIPLSFSMLAIQMWYVYLLIGLYLYLPVFSAWVRQASAKEKQIFLALWALSLFIPYLRTYITHDLWGTCSWNEFGLLYYFAGFNGYLLAGHCIASREFRPGWKTLAAIGIPSFAAGYFITYYGFKCNVSVPGQPEELVELFFTYCSPNVMMMAVPLFIAISKIRISSIVVRRAAESISTCTFGIWMSHYLFVGPCFRLVQSLPVHTMLKLVVCTILVLSLTWAFVYLVRKTGRIGRIIMG